MATASNPLRAPLRRPLLLTIGALFFAGCASVPPAERLGQLEARARALEAEVTQSNSVGRDQQREFDRLITDIKAYNAATARHEISVERATFVTPCGTEPAFSALQPEPDRCTPNCPIFPPNRPKGYFCLPDGGSFCDPRSGVTVCSYRCVRIPFTGAIGAARPADSDGGLL